MEDVQELKNFNITIPINRATWFLNHYQKYLEISSKEKINDKEITFLLKSDHYIGVIALPNGESIRITPKIKNAKFLYMLSKVNIEYAKLLNPIVKGIKYDDIFGFFHELINSFLNEAENLLKKYIIKKPKEQISCISKIKGKILIKESFNSPNYLLGKFFCRYDEFSFDNFDNQIIKFVLYKILFSSTNTQAVRIKKLLRILSKVTLKNINPRDLNFLHYNKLNEEYRLSHQYCRFFIKKFIFGFEVGKSSIHSFLMNTYDIYQKFLLYLFKRYFPNLNVNIGYSKLNLRTEISKISSERPINLIPDIIISINKQILLIIDAKYKDKLNWREDPFQMNAYLRYSTLLHDNSKDKIFPEGFRNGLLIYPKNYKKDVVFEKYDVGHIELGNIFYQTIDLAQIDSEDYVSNWMKGIEAKFFI